MKCVVSDYLPSRYSANISIGCTDLNPTTWLYTDKNRLMSDYEVTLVNDNSKDVLEMSISTPLTATSVCPFSPVTSGDSLTDIPRQEFFVRFKGPAESKLNRKYLDRITKLTLRSSIRRWNMEGSCRAPRYIPLQVSKHWLCQPNLPPQH
jgi:hypothetical protein